MRKYLVFEKVPRIENILSKPMIMSSKIFEKKYLKIYDFGLDRPRENITIMAFVVLENILFFLILRDIHLKSTIMALTVLENIFL